MIHRKTEKEKDRRKDNNGVSKHKTINKKKCHRQRGTEYFIIE